VAGIIQSCKDIETLESRISNHLNQAKVKCQGYLASCNEDNQLVLVDAREALKGAQEQLADIDLVDTQGIQTEQGIIHISKERIALFKWGCTIPGMCDIVSHASSRLDCPRKLRHGIVFFHTTILYVFLHCI
jgi:hypothetical protein